MTTSKTLAVPGASVYFEVRGNGPALLLIPGGSGDVAPFERLAADVSDRFTVIAYERRGFSRSPLTEPITDEDRLHADADDAVRILDEVGVERADVLGSSSGAIVALDLLLRHPARLDTVIAHEPPLAALVPDGAHYLEVFDEVHDLAETGDTWGAMAAFNEKLGMTPSPPRSGSLPAPIAEMIDRIGRNLPFWFEHELRSYPRYQVDQQALRTLASQLIVAAGEESRDQFPHRASIALAESLGLTTVEFPGDHTGYTADPAGFAAQLLTVLDRR